MFRIANYHTTVSAVGILYTLCKCSVCIKYLDDTVHLPKYIQQAMLHGILLPIMQCTWLELPFSEWQTNDFQSCLFHHLPALILTVSKDKTCLKFHCPIWWPLKKTTSMKYLQLQKKIRDHSNFFIFFQNVLFIGICLSKEVTDFVNLSQHFSQIPK